MRPVIMDLPSGQFFDEEGEIDMADQAGEKGGGEEAVEDAGEIDEIPPQAEKRKRKKIPERLP
jgi:hypothetical protein